jgi:indole-3-glycerol phosphate synthase
MISTLGRIVARTRERVEEKRRAVPLDRVLAMAPTPGAHRQFTASISRPGGVNVIAEFKRRSPSRGIIREDLHPVYVAQGYEIAGAAALSILTEEQFFAGSLDDLQQARQGTLLPTLRKDFIVDPYQVWESWVAGADALLLIVAALSERELKTLFEAATEAGIEALVEVHDAQELARALELGARVVGVNCRDLRSMEVSLETAITLAPLVPEDVVAVAESGIRSGADVRRLRDAGYDAFLVGEGLMESPDPGAALEKLLADAGGREG